MNFVSKERSVNPSHESALDSIDGIREAYKGTMLSSLESGSNPHKLTEPDPPKRHLMISRIPQQIEGYQESDKDNPRNWTVKKKYGIASFVLFSSFVATFGTPVYVASIPGVAESFHISTLLAISPISFYAFGCGIGALLGTAACEVFGRSIVYRVTVPLSLVFTIIGGTAKSFAALAVARSFAGLSSGPCLTVGVGILNDLWDLSLEKTGTLFAVLFALFIIWSTQVGPMASAALVAHHSWRWTFWLSAILVGITAVCSFFIPETYHPQILRTRARKSNLPVPSKGSSMALFLVSVGRPLHMMAVEPIVFPTGLVMAVTQSIIFAYYVAYAILFERVYKFSQFQVGMAFSPLIVGTLLAMPIVAIFDRTTYQKSRAEAIRLGKTVEPEKRLYPAMLGSFLLPISLFWLAWTGRPSIHWIVPILSGIVFGVSYVLNMLCLPIYNNDVYTTHYGASTLAASTFLRFTVSASFPLFTKQMIDRLGFHWATSLLAFVTVAMVPIPWIFFKWGPILRSKSRYLKVETGEK